MFLCLELTTYFLARYINLPIIHPSYSFAQIETFWVDSNENFGVWHRSNSSYEHQNACFKLKYASNSYGARDKEREKISPDGKDRVVVLGDSFVEGFGVTSENRLSDRLEKTTGLEHLNFGTSGDFGTTQEALLYESLAMKFDHDYVMIGMLPNNDFLDDSLEFGKKVHSTRFRPYYEGTYPNYEILYFRESLNNSPSDLTSYLRELTFSYNLWSYLKKLLVYRRQVAKDDYSGYYDYSQDELLKARYSIEKIVRIAGNSGRRVLVFTIPVYADFLRWQRANSLPPLHAALSKAAKEIGFEFLDLLPLMKEKGDARQFYNGCDGHWNDYGHEVASEILLKESSLYQRIMR
jgi:hypothetical protein